MTIAEKLKTTPNAPGVYLIRDAEGVPLYVGKAQSLRKRLQQHFRGRDRAGPWHEVMISRAADFEVIVTHSPSEALLLEATLIKQHQPRFNIRLADDKSYPYLMLTREAYPRLVLMRDLSPQARPEGGRRLARGLHDPHRKSVHRLDEGDLFGPYSDAQAMRKAMRLAAGLFGLRTCRQALRGRRVGTPCLNYHLRRCVGPCTGEVSPAQYAEVVAQVRRFLRGQTDRITAGLRRRMRQAAEALDFEQAAALRDRLQAVERATRDQVVVASRLVERDVAAVAAQEDVALVALLRIRHGRLVGQEHYTLREVAQRSPGEMLAAFLTQHYSQAAWAPRELLLAEPVADAEDWERALAELRGGPVSVRHPQRGTGRRLVEMAQLNAQAALAQALAAGFRRERSTAALADLAELVGLEGLPERIEGFDISNVQGDHATASLVVFTGGQPDKRAYRRFRMRVSGPDDYAMLAEVLRRRLQRAAEGDEKFLPLPDLILVDGGQGQVSAVQRVLEEAGQAELPLVGLAKRAEEVFTPGRAEPLPAEEHQTARYLLQRVRDEAHRFALTYHRGLRGQAMTRSELEQVPGLGPVRRQALLRAFPSLQEMARASEEELAAVPHMSRPAARALREFLARRQSESAGTAQEEGEPGGN